MTGQGSRYTGTLRAVVAGLLVGAVPAAAASADATPATVSISITIGPIAEIRFPEGTVFTFADPAPTSSLADPDDTEALTAEVPFVVWGNAQAVIALQSATLRKLEDLRPGHAASSGEAGRSGAAFLDVDIEYDGRFTAEAVHRAGSMNGAGSPLISRVNVSEGPIEGRFRLTADPQTIPGPLEQYHGELVVAVSAEP